MKSNSCRYMYLIVCYLGDMKMYETIINSSKRHNSEIMNVEVSLPGQMPNAAKLHNTVYFLK